MKSNLRRPYRTYLERPGVLSVEIKYKRQAFPAEVHDVSIGGIGICVPRQGAIIAVMPHETIYLKITGPALPEPLVEPGTVQHARAMGGMLFLGIMFVDWQGLVDRVPPALRSVFNRRVSPRIVLESGHPVKITAKIDGCVEEMAGSMRDLSAEGIGFLVAPEAGRRLLRAETVGIAFGLPWGTLSMGFTMRLVHVTEQNEAWRFGACFEKVEHGDADAMREEIAARLAAVAQSA